MYKGLSILMFLLLLCGCNTGNTLYATESNVTGHLRSETENFTDKIDIVSSEEPLKEPSQSKTPTNLERLYPAKSEDTNKWGYINKEGEWIVAPKFDGVENRARTSAAADIDFLPAAINSIWGYVGQDGEWKITPRFSECFYFEDGIGSGWYLGESHATSFDHYGDRLAWDETLDFSEGLAQATSITYAKRDAGVNSNLYGYVDKQLNWVIPPRFEPCMSYHLAEYVKTDRYDFRNGLAAVFDKTIGEYGKFGFINKQGQIQIPAQFDQTKPFSDGIAAVYVGEHRIFPTAKEQKMLARGDVYRVENGKWGFINQQGEWVIEPQFDYVQPFSDGLAGVCINDKWGFIDHKGQWVIEPQFIPYNSSLNNPYIFQEGLAVAEIIVAEKDTIRGLPLLGYINKSGEWAIEPKFHSLKPFVGGVAAFTIYGKDKDLGGYINANGEIIISWFE